MSNKSLIPVPIAEALAGLNLPAEVASNPIFGEHAPLVMSFLERVMQPEAFAVVTAGAEGGGGKPDIPITKPAEAGDPAEAGVPAVPIVHIIQQVYGFLLLASTLEFLNIKTLGAGIIKVIGLDDTQTQLLSGREVEAMRKRLTRRALRAIAGWLNDEGMAELNELEPGPGKLRMTVI